MAKQINSGLKALLLSVELFFSHQLQNDERKVLTLP